jgi:hypothetical protein
MVLSGPLTGELVMVERLRDLSQTSRFRSIRRRFGRVLFGAYLHIIQAIRAGDGVGGEVNVHDLATKGDNEDADITF